MRKNSPYIKVGIVLADHFFFVSLPELTFPVLSIVVFPFSPTLSHLPVSANHIVTGTLIIITRELVLEAIRHLFKFNYWALLK